MALIELAYPRYTPAPEEMRRAIGIHGCFGAVKVATMDASGGTYTWDVRLGDAAGLLLPRRAFLITRLRARRVVTALTTGLLRLTGAVPSEDPVIVAQDNVSYPLYCGASAYDFSPGNSTAINDKSLSELVRSWGWIIPFQSALVPRIEVEMALAVGIVAHLSIFGYYVDIEPGQIPWGLWYGI